MASQNVILLCFVVASLVVRRQCNQISQANQVMKGIIAFGRFALVLQE